MNALEFHEKYAGKIEINVRTPINSREDLSLAYTPGVAEPCLEIAKDKSKVYKYTRKNNLVAVITDGSAVLGLGNIGAEASLPVMEGKCVLFKEFGGVDAFPIALTTQDPDEVIETIKRLEPIFGGINLEDISAPNCFYIEEELKKQMNIPVFHDDQHGTAIVVLAGLINAAKIVNKNIKDLRVVINGVGAAGVATSKLLMSYGIHEILFVDSEGLICNLRTNLNSHKQKLLESSDLKDVCGSLFDAVKNADVFIGVSKPGLLTSDMIRTMAKDPIVFALANPTPEIMPLVAIQAGAAVVATGRSDFPNQINNVLAFPGIFRGLLDAGLKSITVEMKIAVAEGIASYIEKPTAENIIPNVLDKNVSKKVADVIRNFSV